MNNNHRYITIRLESKNPHLKGMYFWYLQRVDDNLFLDISIGEYLKYPRSGFETRERLLKEIKLEYENIYDQIIDENKIYGAL